MRIALFSDNFYPELSGISDSLISLSKELAKRGHRIHFFVPKYSEADHKISNAPFGEINLGPNVEISRLSSFYFGAGSRQGRAVIPCGFRTLAVKEFDPDIIHTQTFFGVGLEAYLASRFLHKPLVGTNHTATKEFLRYNPLKSAWTNALILKYVNWYYERCITVTGPSRSVFREMEETGFKKKGVALSNPIETEIFKPLENRAALRKKWKLGNYPIVHAGRLANERSIDVIIRALPLVQREIPEAELMLAGRGADEQGLRDLAQSLGVSNSVKFPGFVDQAHMVEIMNAGKVFAITSTADTQSMVMMQAMACGTPVVGVNARALPEYIDKENGFVVEPNDPEALAERLIEILKNPQLQKNLGAGGRATALRYSPPEIATRWEEIYTEAITKSQLT
jgi:1,2-diacylglycerol 3-alpha-glucosyltransferase